MSCCKVFKKWISEQTPIVFKMSAILRAVRENDLKKVKALLTMDPDGIEELDSKERNPLMIAIEHKHNDLAEYLIKCGQDVDDIDINGLTALMIAIELRNTEGAKLLIRYNADIDQQDNDGMTALAFAAYYGNEEMVRILLMNEADPDLPNAKQQTPIDLARDNGFTDIVKIFEEKEADPSLDLLKPKPKHAKLKFALPKKTDNKKKTPQIKPKTEKESLPQTKPSNLDGIEVDQAEIDDLIKSFEKESDISPEQKVTNITKNSQIEKSGTDEEIQNLVGSILTNQEQNATPPKTQGDPKMSSQSNEEIVQLVNKFADNEIPFEKEERLDDSEVNAIIEETMGAIEIGQNPNMTSQSSVGKNIENVADALAVPFNESKPMFSVQTPDVSESDTSGSLRSLMSSTGSRTEVIDGETLITTAILTSDLALLTLELEIGSANIEEKNSTGLTPIILAASLHKSEYVKVLIEHGAKVNSCDSKGNTALHYAAYYNDGPTIQELMDGHASPYVKNNQGKTPNDVAEHQNNIDALILMNADDEGLTTRLLNRLADPNADNDPKQPNSNDCVIA